MVDIAAHRRTRSQFFRLVGIRDLNDRVLRHAPAILTEDPWGDWKGVLHQEIPVPVGEEMIMETPTGESRCLVEDKSNGQTLLVGLDPSPF